MDGAEVKYIVDDKGDRSAVIIPINEYEELMEDLHDLAVIAERREEPVIWFEELKKKLRADGLLWNRLEKLRRARPEKNPP
jgi:hypothetical protein